MKTTATKTPVKINTVIANALAYKVIETLRANNQERKEEMKKTISVNPQIKEVIKLYKQAEEIRDKANAIETAFEKKHNCSLSINGKVCDVYRINGTSLPDQVDIKNDILISSAFEGKDADVIIADLVKKYSK